MKHLRHFMNLNEATAAATVTEIKQRFMDVIKAVYDSVNTLSHEKPKTKGSINDLNTAVSSNGRLILKGPNNLERWVVGVSANNIDVTISADLSYSSDVGSDKVYTDLVCNVRTVSNNKIIDNVINSINNQIEQAVGRAPYYSANSSWNGSNGEVTYTGRLTMRITSGDQPSSNVKNTSFQTRGVYDPEVNYRNSSGENARSARRGSTANFGGDDSNYR